MGSAQGGNIMVSFSLCHQGLSDQWRGQRLDQVPQDPIFPIPGMDGCSIFSPFFPGDRTTHSECSGANCRIPLPQGGGRRRSQCAQSPMSLSPAPIPPWNRARRHQWALRMETLFVSDATDLGIGFEEKALPWLVSSDCWWVGGTEWSRLPCDHKGMYCLCCNAPSKIPRMPFPLASPPLSTTSQRCDLGQGI